ncbi:TIGR03767 family metallophosphoesterase [Streptomyces sp. NBC_01275]|uniref:TIGR03767 family metallophosphoesterase n=1 Tax=Streptomyces sp. NBC_01275 TaxID=2903807 RepID=UPI0022522B2B|nr:TIGR03767 family metallophosphoesterase [Streptomyces sp. NBC_01275]MCX4762181.1 TIGR03767 family metallophosphoesterase [Streptomyces sp. NBC_01275]
MSRTRSVTSSSSILGRRTVLAATAAVSVSAGVGYALRPTDSQAAPASATPETTSAPEATRSPAPVREAAATRPLAPYTKGTTLASVAAPGTGSGYHRMGSAAGWRRVVRDDLAAAKTGRAGRRTTLTSFVQLTDLHLIDSQHPLRLEYFRAASEIAWRPHEALTVQGAVSLIERVNSLRAAPVTGAPLDFVITTGDNTDNNAHTELDWYLTVMSGGRITPNSGDPRHYEGVQNSGINLYWQPDSTTRDLYKQRGFPHMDGFLAAALREVRSPGLALPWYSTVGNHDAMPLGCYAHGDSYLAEYAVGGRKLMELSPAEATRVQQSISQDRDPRGTVLRDLLKSKTRAMRSVTPDERRAPYTPVQHVKAHLDPTYQGAGPVGHGYTAANLAAGTQYYTFPMGENVIGISLDTTDPGGHYNGSIGTAQLKWLDATLRAHKDVYAVVFSHHTSESMSNTRPDPAHPAERRHDGAELTALLGRHRNVVAWVNGHIHRNDITPHRGSAGGSFWEVSTASHVEFPQLARVIELVDNKDGTLSIHTTLIESAAPHRTDFTDLSQTGLAALYRELSANARSDGARLGGEPQDRNTELVLKKS